LEDVAKGRSVSVPRYLRNWQHEFDYLYVIGQQNRVLIPDLLEKIETAAGFTLYKIRSDRSKWPPERLRRAQSRAAAHDRAPKVTVSAAPAADGGDSELNLIGMRTADALRRLEEFLDQAYLTNRAEVRIVHGIGSGALKKAVHEYLSDSPYCAGFHQADPHRGGAGATVVQLNL